MQYLHSKLAITGAIQAESTSFATEGHAAVSVTIQSVASDGVILHVLHANLHT